MCVCNIGLPPTIELGILNLVRILKWGSMMGFNLIHKTGFEGYITLCSGEVAFSVYLMQFSTAQKLESKRFQEVVSDLPPSPLLFHHPLPRRSFLLETSVYLNRKFPVGKGFIFFCSQNKILCASGSG